MALISHAGSSPSCRLKNTIHKFKRINKKWNIDSRTPVDFCCELVSNQPIKKGRAGQKLNFKFRRDHENS